MWFSVNTSTLPFQKKSFDSLWVKASVRREGPALDNREDEIRKLRQEYENELTVWRNKFSKSELEKENSLNLEKVFS